MKTLDRLEALPFVPALMKREKRTITPIDAEIHRLGQMAARGSSFVTDPFFIKLEAYLDWAKREGLFGQAALDACIDLAGFRASALDSFYDDIRKDKTVSWQKAQMVAQLTDRPSRVINLELDPIYFQAMLDGRKTVEGRAYDPDSSKNYPDIRPGDIARYRLSLRKPEFADQISKMGLMANTVMVRSVAMVHFDPSVFGMYENVGELGEHFQPMLPGLHNVLARGAVYYNFPGYTDRITDHGFLGIEHPANEIELHTDTV